MNAPSIASSPPGRVAAIQMVSTPIVRENLDVASQLIAKAAESGARLVALPEYFCFMGQKDHDKLAIRETEGDGPIQAFLADQARRHSVYVVGGTLPLASPDASRVFNTSLVYGPDGNRLVRYDKIHLFNFKRGTESYDESIAIRPGNDVRTIDTPFARVGLSVCYDLRFPELYRALGQVDLILVPAAFTYTTGKAHWELLLRARAVENQCYVLAPAQGGSHPNGRRTWGHSMLIDPWGDIVDVLPEGPGVVAGNIEPARLSEVRTALPALRHRVM
ncbi:carbon-nitrogen hydrolase family protein [Bordetella genomosp. 11]|uniref:Acyltransferase n=1 Tax=Bordetella genomosp. 11 TaxID=1416808 RepID=A0A261UHF1_9BORD|nr:carbon-nitrogen hydrolase family protein [Bordetella genomosp. 11]OZI61344.1 acyltransferase [Bordetella genomosp. 11]